MSLSRQSFLQRFFLKLWYKKSTYQPLFIALLLPISWLFQALAAIRRYYYLSYNKSTLTVPVVVVGNISTGGVGKTPLVIALAEALVERGIQVGVVSRGYGSQSRHFPLSVTRSTPVSHSGDEAFLIAQQLNCPVVIGPDRVAAAQYLLENNPSVQLLLSDDGLQHYKLGRSLEIVVIDGERGMGNGYCLPAGPLREPEKRLSTVDWVVVNGENTHFDFRSQLVESKVLSVTIKPDYWYGLVSQEKYPLSPFPWGNANSVIAVAAIGNPQRFFNALTSLALTTESFAFDDHHQFSAEDFQQWGNKVVLMTMKDAVKCSAFARDNWWALGASVQLPDNLLDSVVSLINKN